MRTFRNPTIVSSFIVVMFVFFIIFTFSSTGNFLLNLSGAPFQFVSNKGDDLDLVLEKVSMADSKTVIIAVFNKAYVEVQQGLHISMLDLFLESFWLGDGTRPLIKNLLIAAVDQTAYDRCVFRGLHCYFLGKETEGSNLSVEEVYGSNGYIDMTWRKVLFCFRVIKKGYNFVFTDSDIVWLRNPFTYLGTNMSIDVQFSTDHLNKGSRADENPINTGFYFIRSNNKTISLFERWCSKSNDTTRINDQDALQNLVRKKVLSELNVNASVLETRYFSGFCEDSDDLSKVVTVHANCCSHIKKKAKDLTQVLEEWKKFKQLPLNESSTMRWSPHTNCTDSWKSK